MLGRDFVLVSGFMSTYQQSTAETYALDTTDPNAPWRRMDDLPVSAGITHAASVVIGTKYYMCGGYLGGHPGQDIDDCLVYDHMKAPGTGQWSSFASLPEGRAGGGMVYDSERDALYFSAGAVRPQAGNADADDYPDTWMYSFDNPSAGWVSKTDIPFLANHMSSVTAKDATGRERHYFLGGQKGEDEYDGNNADNYEWDAQTEAWIERESMLFTRGHAAESTRAIGCGFIIAAGSTNEFGKTSDVSYYDISSDTWTSIGDLPNSINTPICDISGNYLYCESGWVNGNFSYRRQITW